MKSLIRPFDILRRFSTVLKSKFYKPTQFDGFYRALVICSNDPLNAGRVKIYIPALMHEKYKEKAHGIWAWPTSFWAGANTNATEDHSYNMMKDFGGFMPPPDGSFVYIFFENGDFNKPRYLPFGPGLSGGENLKDNDIDPYIPQENQNGSMPWFKWMLMKTPFGRAFFVSDDPSDAMIMMRGYNRVVENECKSEKKDCNPDIPDKSIGPYHCGDEGNESYDGLNSPKAINNKNGIANSMFLIYEGHNDDGNQTHDFLLTRDYRHNFIKMSSATWTPSDTPVDKDHCNESKDQIEWAIMEHEKSRDKKRIDRIYNHANIKWVLNTEKTHACDDDKLEFSEENIDYMVQMPDWVDIEENGHRFWMNLRNGNPCDNCSGGGTINIKHQTKPIVTVDSSGCNCRWKSDESDKERRGIGVLRVEHGLKWVVGEDTPEDETLFTQYHTGTRFMEYLFNGEFLIQDVNHQGFKGFIELFPGCSPQDVNGEGEFKFYARLCDGHSLWESELADTSIEMIPLAPGICNPKTKANTFVRMTGRGKMLLQSKKNMFIEMRENGGCANGIGDTFFLMEENGHIRIQSKSGSYIEFTPKGHIIINSIAGEGKIYEN